MTGWHTSNRLFVDEAQIDVRAIVQMAVHHGVGIVTLHWRMLNDPNLPRLAVELRGRGIHVEQHLALPLWTGPLHHNGMDGVCLHRRSSEHGGDVARRYDGEAVLAYGCPGYTRRMDEALGRMRAYDIRAAYLDEMWHPGWGHDIPTMPADAAAEIEAPVVEFAERARQLRPDALIGTSTGGEYAKIRHTCPFAAPTDWERGSDPAANLERMVREVLDAIRRSGGMQRGILGWIESQYGRWSLTPEWVRDLKARQVQLFHSHRQSMPWWMRVNYQWRLHPMYRGVAAELAEWPQFDQAGAGSGGPPG